MNFDVLSSWSGDLTSQNMATQGQYDASAQLQTLCDRPVSLMMASASAEPGKSVKGLDPGYSAIIELNAENLRNVPSFCEQGQVSRAVTMTGASSDPLVGPVPGLSDGEGQSVQFASGNNTMVRAWENPSGQRVVTDVYRPGCGASALNSPGIAAASELQRR